MRPMLAIREAVAADHPAIRRVNREAFGRDDEGVLVQRLRDETAMLFELVADDCDIVGHIAFSALALTPPRPAGKVAALAPMAVTPARQRAGVGSALVRAGLETCRARGIAAVVVLGHPGFYPRFGFAAAAASGLRAPFSGPEFMALELVAGALPAGAALRYPESFGIAG
jgi:putative acetyltransferase